MRTGACRFCSALDSGTRGTPPEALDPLRDPCEIPGLGNFATTQAPTAPPPMAGNGPRQASHVLQTATQEPSLSSPPEPATTPHGPRHKPPFFSSAREMAAACHPGQRPGAQTAVMPRCQGARAPRPQQPQPTTGTTAGFLAATALPQLRVAKDPARQPAAGSCLPVAEGSNA